MKSALTHLIKISVANIEGCFSNLPKLKNTMTSEVTSNFLFQMTFLQKHNVAKEKEKLNWKLIIIQSSHISSDEVFSMILKKPTHPPRVYCSAKNLPADLFFSWKFLVHYKLKYKIQMQLDE